MLPASASRLKNSSIVKTFADKRFASSSIASSARSIYSSLKVSIAEGSMPTSGVCSFINGDKSLIFFSAIAFSLREKPFESHHRPLSVRLAASRVGGRGPNATRPGAVLAETIARALNLVEAARWCADAIKTNPGYAGILDGFANARPAAQIESAIWASSWASGHYANGAHWHYTPVEVVKAPPSAWGL